MEESKVAILMATYNGERFLSEQIESILRQSYGHWELYIRDDGSTDGTVEIIKTYCSKYPEKIILVADPSDRHGSTANFATLQQYVTNQYSYDYFMFSDQDDIWLENKIELALHKMKEAECEKTDPILVHTDLKVVDENLKVLGDSFFKYRALCVECKDLRHLLVQNNATGCTMMWNKQLNDVLQDSLLYKDVFQHDWWLSLTACCFGRIIVIKEPTILYRQHGNNTVGATKVNTIGFILLRLIGHNHVQDTLVGSVKQAGAFLDRYKNLLTEEQIEILSAFSELYKMNKVKRQYTVLREGFLKQGIVQIIGELMYI